MNSGTVGLEIVHCLNGQSFSMIKMTKNQWIVIIVLLLAVCGVYGVGLFFILPFSRVSPEPTAIAIESGPVEMIFPASVPHPTMNPAEKSGATTDIVSYSKDPKKYIGYKIGFNGVIVNITEDQLLTFIQLEPIVDNRLANIYIATTTYSTRTNMKKCEEVKIQAIGAGSIEFLNTQGLKVAQPLVMTNRTSDILRFEPGFISTRSRECMSKYP